MPAWLLIPDGPEAAGAGAKPRRPAMLCLHQTVAIGKDEPIGLGGKPNLHYAMELARRGYVAIAPDYPGFGEYKIDVYKMGYASATMKANLEPQAGGRSALRAGRGRPRSHRRHRPLAGRP